MWENLSSKRIKYPPSDPIATSQNYCQLLSGRTDISENLSESEALETIRNLPPPFRIGKKSGWLNDDTNTMMKLSNWTRSTHRKCWRQLHVTQVVHLSNGQDGALTPNVIHKQARSILEFFVPSPPNPR